LNRRPNAPQGWLDANNSIFVSKDTAFAQTEFQKFVQKIDWDDYKNWLYNNKSKYYARFLLNAGKKWKELAFTNQLVEYPNNRTKEDILKGITNLTRYLDIKHDTKFHNIFLEWMKRKELKWKYVNSISIPKEISIKQILKNANQLSEKYRFFVIFSLVSGLRTFETIKVLNNHQTLCHDGIIEMYWDRRTKKSNAVFCYPLLHKKCNYNYSENTIHRNIKTEILGCQIKYLRKINYTIIATRINPLLAEFMQGRRGNVSQRHYFLPMMQQNRNKWIRIWNKILEN